MTSAEAYLHLNKIIETVNAFVSTLETAAAMEEHVHAAGRTLDVLTNGRCFVVHGRV